MKMDNQALVKHRFWFLLPMAMILILVAFFLLFGPRAAALKTWSDAKANDDQFKSLASAKIRSEENIRKTAEERRRAEQEKLDLWVKFYDMQNRIVRIPEPPPKTEQPVATAPGVRPAGGEIKAPEPVLRLGKIDPEAPFEPLIKWPRTRNVDMNEVSFPVTIGGEEVIRRIKDLDFMEPIPSDKLDKFPTAFESVYPEMLKIIDWVDETKGYGSVQALDSQANRPGQGKSFRTSRDAAFDLLVKNSRADNLKPVNYQEAWTLLEDAAVKRELLFAIAEVNKLMSDMLPEWEEKLFFPQVTMPSDKPKDKAGDPQQPGGHTPVPTQTATVPAKPATPATKSETRPASQPATRPNEEKIPPEPKVEQIDRRVFQNWYWLTFDHWSFYGPQWKIDQTGKFVLDRKPEKLAPVWNTQAVWKLDLEVVKVPERMVEGRTEPAKLLLQGLAFNESLDPKVRVPECRLEVFFADIYDREIKTSQPVYIDDAGDLGPSKRDEETGRFKGRELKPIELPPELLKARHGVLRIARIARKMDKALAEDKEVRYLDQKRMWNRGWLMDLRLIQSPTPQNSFILEGTVFNRLPRQQRPTFYVLQLRTDTGRIVTHRFRVPGPVIDSGEERQFKIVVNELDSSRDPNEPRSKINEAIITIESIQQELDWRTVPVKRIDAIETGRLAHEYSNRKRVEDPGLHPYPFGNKTGPGTALPEGDKDKAPPAQPPTGGAPPTAPGNAPPSASNLPPTTNNVEWLRYNGAPTTEVRRLPIAVVVIIDETYMNELMTSLANSRLRIQVTMAVWHHLQWPWEEPLWQMAGSAPDPGPSRPGSTQPAGTAPTRLRHDESLSVVKLQVYGVASIYESPDAHDAREKLRKQAADKQPAR